MEQKKREVVILVGTGVIGSAIAKRVCDQKHVLLGDYSEQNLEAVAEEFKDSGISVTTQKIDVTKRSSVEDFARLADSLGTITHLIHAVGVSPSQASINQVLNVDLYGTALVLEIFRDYITKGSSGIVVSSQSGHRLSAFSEEENSLLATTPSNELLNLKMLKEEKIRDSLHAYQIAKKANGLRVMAEAVNWGKKGARLNAISPGIVLTPLAQAELNGPRGEEYRKMIERCPAGRAGRPEEIANIAAMLMGNDGAFITGSDILIDGGVTAAYFYGDITFD